MRENAAWVATVTSRPVRPPLRILVVEDNADVGELVQCLACEWGHEAVLVENAEAAVTALELAAGGFDVVLSDISLPGASGLDLAHWAKQRWPAVRIVLSTGHCNFADQSALRGLELLEKPYSPEQLQNILAAPASSPSAPLEA